jgi:hypothetical protein
MLTLHMFGVSKSEHQAMAIQAVNFQRHERMFETCLWGRLERCLLSSVCGEKPLGANSPVG